MRYFQNVDRYDDGLSGSRIGNNRLAIDWQRKQHWTDTRSLKGCSTVQKIVMEIVIEIGKPCSTMQKFVIEIVIEIVTEMCMEQTRLFQ